MPLSNRIDTQKGEVSDDGNRNGTEIAIEIGKVWDKSDSENTFISYAKYRRNHDVQINKEGKLDMSCPKHKHLEHLLEDEKYKDFSPYTGNETDFMGRTQADYIKQIRRDEGEEYYQRNKNWLWSRIAWELYLGVAR